MAARGVTVRTDRPAYELGEPINITLEWAEAGAEPEPEPAELLVGWSCPISNLASRLRQFPGTKYIRIFRQAGQGLPTWAQLEPIPGDVTVHLSVKDRGLPIGDWLSSRPARWTAPLLFTLDHEPEQQDGGDPTPAEYVDEWAELCDSLADHPRREQIVLTPTFTRYAAEVGSDRDAWYQDFGRVVELAVDAVAFDVYNSGSTYQTSAQMFAWAVGFATQHGLPLYIAEWGRERKGGDDGTVCAQRMRDDVAYLRRQPQAFGIAWFYTGGDNLDTGANGGPRTPERQALAELIQEA